MMHKMDIAESVNHVGKTVTLMGWVHSVRDHKKVVFIDLIDRSGLIQIVAGPDAAPLSPQSVIAITGLIKKRPEKLVNAKIATGEIEMEATSFEVLSAAHTLPFDMNKEELDVTLPTLLDYRSLTLRHDRIKAIFKVQDAIAEGFRSTAREHGCTEIFVPTIAASSTEGGAEVFKIDYYDYKATLTQSPQLYKQMMVPVFEKVFTFAHAYRAEPSVTTRHLSETVQMDCEFGFVDFEELLDLLEKTVVSMLKHVEKVCAKELAMFNVAPIGFGKVPRLTLQEALEIVFKETGRDNRGEKDLAPQDEVDICRWSLEKHNSDIVIITHFPTKKRAFYTMPDPANPELSLSYDVLFRGLEMSSGSQRIHDYDQLLTAITERGMNPADFHLYLMAFQYGMPPEGGFSFGLERLTKNVLGLANVREGSLFPRDMERVDIRLSQQNKK
jgi:nondiscriminating aspartyl-tRNA synthetase